MQYYHYQYTHHCFLGWFCGVGTSEAAFLTINRWWDGSAGSAVGGRLVKRSGGIVEEATNDRSL
jgi:hypothetical protein